MTNRTLHGHLEMQSVQKYFTRVNTLREFSYRFVSPRGHVISSIYWMTLAEGN